MIIRTLELIFSIYINFILKVGTEETRISGRTMRYAFRIEKNLLYNYELGKNTKELRYYLAILFLPSLFRQIRGLNNSF